MLLFASCKEDIKDSALKQLKITMTELAKNPDTYKITNIKEVYRSPSDSLIVISFQGKGQNGFGGWSSSSFEYAYHIGAENSRFEILRDLEKDEPFLDFANSVGEDLFKEHYKDDPQKYIDHAIIMYMLFNGRILEHCHE